HLRRRRRGPCAGARALPRAPRRHLVGRELRRGDRDRAAARQGRRRADGLLRHGRALSHDGPLPPGGGHLTMAWEPKVGHLRSLLGELDTVLVAFSGGVDSSFLLHVAADVLGARCVALTTVSPTTPAGDLDDARALAATRAVEHVVHATDELAVP